MVVAAPALGALAAFAAMCFLVFLYYAYGYTLGALLVGLENLFRSIGVSLGWFGRISLGFIADGLATVDNTIRQALGSGIIATRDAGLYLWHYAAYALREVGDALADLAEHTEHALTRTVTVTVPTYVTNRLAWLSAHVAALETTVAHLPARVERITTERVHTVTRTVVHEAATVVRPLTLPNIRPLEREADALAKRVGNIARALAPAAVVGLIGATIFRQFDLGWLRCRGVGRVGRSLCGLSGLIEAAAADALTAFAAIDLCWFVNGVMTAAENVRGLLLDFVDLENALIGRCGGSAAKPLVLRAVSQTPVVDGLTLKAL